MIASNHTRCSRRPAPQLFIRRLWLFAIEWHNFSPRVSATHAVRWRRLVEVLYVCAVAGTVSTPMLCRWPVFYNRPSHPQKTWRQDITRICNPDDTPSDSRMQTGSRFVLPFSPRPTRRLRQGRPQHGFAFHTPYRC